MTRDRHQTRLALGKALLAVLLEAARERHARDHLVDTPDGPEMGWMAWERQAMTNSVNYWRGQQGLSPIDEAETARVERQAAGHIDYAEKYAWGLAELAMEDDGG